MAITRVLPAYTVNMGGLPLLQPLPTQEVDQINPFLLLHHHSNEVPAGSTSLQEGVGPHPHRGFTPVTFMYSGGVHHRDSRGNSSVVTDGGVQWMDVGLGIVHSERPPQELCDRGGKQEIIQVWINLPKALKMMEPNYIPFQRDELGAVEGHPLLKVSAGIPVPNGAKGPVSSAYPVKALHGTASSLPLSLQVDSGENGMLYLLNGGGRMEGYGILEGTCLYQMNEGTHLLYLQEGTKVLFLSAKPIQEKKESYGPFVMNSQTEILEAMRDYQMGKMGILIESELP
jgi:redox-sensitive bicupin YhaK (pirin superfamily)